MPGWLAGWASDLAGCAPSLAGWASGLAGWASDLTGWPRGGTHGLMDKQKNSPFYRTLSPIGTVAKKVVMDQGTEEEEEEEEEVDDEENRLNLNQ